jgi:hypothetical protein
MSNKKTNNYPGLHPIKGQYSGHSSKTRVLRSILEPVFAGETVPNCHVLVAKQALDLFCYVLL